MGVVLTNSDELKTIADAIRTKSGTSSLIEYPDGMVAAIGNIAFECTATSSDILSPKTAYVENAKITGNIPSKAAATYNTSTTDQTIASGQYLTGDQTIKSVTTSNISAANVKYNVNVKVGDANNSGRISDVTGTFTGDGTVDAGEMLADKTAYVKGNKVTGTIASKAAATYNTSTSDQTISAGQYLSGAQTIKAVTTSNLTAANVKNGVNIKVGDSNEAGRIINVTGTFGNDATVAAGDMLSGKIAYNGANKITGSIPSKAAATYNTSTSDQTITTGQYISGVQTIKAVTTANISAANIKNGVVVKVGDANSATRIANVTGTFTGDGTAAAGDILSGKIGYVKGNKITGNIASLAATTYNASTSDQTIAAGKYLSGAQTIRKITTANISAANIKKGVTIQVGDSGSATRIANVTGTCNPFAMMGSTQVPMIFHRNQSFGGWYYQGTSGSYASETTVGYYSIYGYVTGETKTFVVPTKITFTIFTGWHVNNTTTITLNPNTYYELRGTSSSGSQVFKMYQGSTYLTDFFKIVSWAYV